MNYYREAEDEEENETELDLSDLTPDEIEALEEELEREINQES